MIPIVHTQFLLEEKDTDGHSPMYFLCDDGNYYYCKYRTQFKKEELDCLVYEMICTLLLQKLNIPTPDIALAVIEKDSYDAKKLKANKRYIKPGIICFASREAKNTTLITGIQSVKPKTIKKIVNIYDLLKIAMFDMWVDNTDRGRGERQNYNLLQQLITIHHTDKNTLTHKFRWLAFDHAFAFGGEDNLRIFNETFLPDTSYKLIESQYFNYFKKYFNNTSYEILIENFLSLQHHEIDTIIQSVFSQIPAEWQIPASLADRISAFLSNKERIKKVKQLTLQTLAKK